MIAQDGLHIGSNIVPKIKVTYGDKTFIGFTNWLCIRIIVLQPNVQTGLAFTIVSLAWRPPTSHGDDRVKMTACLQRHARWDWPTTLLGFFFFKSKWSAIELWLNLSLFYFLKVFVCIFVVKNKNTYSGWWLIPQIQKYYKTNLDWPIHRQTKLSVWKKERRRQNNFNWNLKAQSKGYWKAKIWIRQKTNKTCLASCHLKKRKDDFFFKMAGRYLFFKDNRLGYLSKLIYFVWNWNFFN